MARFGSLLMNAFPRLVLASPAHQLMSGRYATLLFTGRRTGRRFSLPVAYVEDGDRILVSTDSAWWHNLADGRPFDVRLRGRRRTVTATRLDSQGALNALRSLVALPGYAKAAGIKRSGGAVEEADLVHAATERVVLALSPLQHS